MGGCEHAARRGILQAIKHWSLESQRTRLPSCTCKGDELSGESCRSFMRELNAEVVPPYMVASKDVVKEKMAPIWTKKKNVPKVTDSFHQYMVNVS